MSKIQLLVDEFGEVSNEQGWVECEGDYCESVSNKYNKIKNTLLERISELEKSARIPLEPTEEMIRAACINQCSDKYDTYEDWKDSHSSGIVETIRNIIISDYIAMMKVV